MDRLPATLSAPRGRPDLLVIAGEHSGDEHAARMVRELLASGKVSNVCAVGGPALEKAGAQLLCDLTAFSVVGLFEVLKHYGEFKRLFNAVVEWVRAYRPRAVCLVDYPGFNLRLAKALKKAGLSRKGGGDIAVFDYIGPQIWAWKARRRFTMARDLDALAARSAQFFVPVSVNINAFMVLFITKVYVRTNSS
jgi:lipid-A-disaccharide synthase